MNLQALTYRVGQIFGMMDYTLKVDESEGKFRYDGPRKMSMNPLTLSFPVNLEEVYQEDFFHKSLNQVRFILILGIFFYGIFGILDAKMMPEAKSTLWFIRYAIVTPMIAGVVLFTYSRYFKPLMQLCLACIIVVCGLGIVIMIAIAPPPVNYSYYAGLILVLIFGYVFLRIRFIWATLAGWVIVVFYEIAAIWINQTPVEILFNNNFFFISANFIGMFASYSIEYYSRRDFYLAQLLEIEQEKVYAANQELEARVRERTSQLLETNEELVKEIEAHRRAEEEKRGLESQLRQAQKMEAIGTLAGGIAHDFNNILSPIIGYSEMILDDLPKYSKVRGKLEQILLAANRAKDLVRHILTFSRETEQELVPLEIQPIIKETLKLLRASLPSTIEIKQKIDTNCGLVMADPTQIHQVIMNLCTNSFHAMREKGGTLCVEVTEVDVSPSDLMFNMNLKPGPHMRLTVSDTGHGMERSLVDRIFDPYFTTKAPGEGTGLGLAVVHGIVKSYNGDIKIYSEPSKGTTIHIYLPCVDVGMDGVEPARVDTDVQGSEHILIVDDEEYVVNMMKEMLERLGYRVTAFTNSVKALNLFKKNHTTFDLVITDQTMPNLTGAELSTEMMKLRPGIPIILCTGFSEILSEDKAKALGIREYISKPIVKSEISKAVRNALDG
ncbi:MAG: hybrid sensor histidine kinase/response regulator [Desulfomonilia bacterium]